MRSSTPLGPDTIAAIATPIGESAVAVVRVSGPGALDIAAPLIGRPGVLAALDTHRLTRITLIDPRSGNAIDDALCAVMRAPRSYTGEHTVEFFCHGSPALARMLMERLVDQGARLAEPGEFTRRAFINGRLDLAQAEAVALLIGARTERAVALAARSVAGELSRRVATLRSGVLDVVARMEVALDFPEDIPMGDSGEIPRKINMLRDDAAGLAAATRRGMLAHTGLTVAIAGAPNAGKSSLFNALLGRNRAIVTPEAGTTRDVIEGTVVLCGVPVRLLDTAGIGTPRDAIDAEGMRRAREAIEESDVVLLVVDGSRPSEGGVVPESLSGRLVVARSKSDLGLHPEITCPPGAIPTSTVTAGGLDHLMERLRAEIGARAAGDGGGNAVTASMRQMGLIEDLAGALARASDVIATHPIEISLIELRCALAAGSSILGVEVGDAVLDEIFSRFCVGK